MVGCCVAAPHLNQGQCRPRSSPFPSSSSSLLGAPHGRDHCPPHPRPCTRPRPHPHPRPCPCPHSSPRPRPRPHPHPRPRPHPRPCHCTNALFGAVAIALAAHALPLFLTIALFVAVAIALAFFLTIAIALAAAAIAVAVVVAVALASLDIALFATCHPRHPHHRSLCRPPPLSPSPLPSSSSPSPSHSTPSPSSSSLSSSHTQESRQELFSLYYCYPTRSSLIDTIAGISLYHTLECIVTQEWYRSTYVCDAVRAREPSSAYVVCSGVSFSLGSNDTVTMIEKRNSQANACQH